MKVLSIYKYAIIFILAIVLSPSAYAVFEGRNEQIQEYTTIRQEVEIVPFGSKASDGIPSGLDGLGSVEDATPFMAPIGDDALLVSLLSGGLVCVIYMFAAKRKVGKI